MKYAIDFDENIIRPINSDTDKYQYESYQQTDSFPEAKNMLVEYWENVVIMASNQLKVAKKLKI